MKPRIGIIHYSYPPIIGGVETIVRQQAHKFAENGFQVTLLMGEGHTSRKNVNFVEVPEFRSLRNIDPDLYQQILDQKEFPQEFNNLSNQIYGKLENLLKDIDTVIVHNMLTFKFNLAFNDAFIRYVEKNPEKKVIAWTHDVSLNTERKRAVFVNDKVEDLMYKPIPSVIYVGISNFLKKTLEEKIGFPSGMVHVIPNSIPIEEFLDLHPSTIKIINKYDLFNVNPLIFMPGKMMAHKNIDVAVKTVSELKKLYPKVKLVFSARTFHHNKNDAYVKRIDEIINELGVRQNVIIIPDELAPDEDNFEVVKDFYKINDVIFFFSSYENFGLPILEAGITKTPILCNDLEVFHEISDNNLYFTDISKPPSEIADYVRKILEEEKSVSLFREVKRKYSLDLVFKKQILPLIDTKINFT